MDKLGRDLQRFSDENNDVKRQLRTLVSIIERLEEKLESNTGKEGAGGEKKEDPKGGSPKRGGGFFGRN